MQPIHKAEFDDDQHCRREVQPNDLPLAQYPVESHLPGVAHGYTCIRGAARLKNRNAATTTTRSIPKTTVSIFGLRVLSGSKGFRGSRKTFSARFTTPMSDRCFILVSNAAMTSLAVTRWTTGTSSQSGRRLRTASRTSSVVVCLSSIMTTAPELHSRYRPHLPGRPVSQRSVLPVGGRVTGRTRSRRGQSDRAERQGPGTRYERREPEPRRSTLAG